MLNSVNSNNFGQNVFRDFTKNTDNTRFFITPKELEKKEPSTHKGRNLAFAIGSSALFVGVGFLVLMRGLPKILPNIWRMLKTFWKNVLKNLFLKVLTDGMNFTFIL